MASATVYSIKSFQSQCFTDLMTTIIRLDPFETCFQKSSIFGTTGQEDAGAKYGSLEPHKERAHREQM